MESGLTGSLGTVELESTSLPLLSQEITTFLLLRAFAAGCTALTGVEAISNGIPAFEPNESHNAGQTLDCHGAAAGHTVRGYHLLAHQIRRHPGETETILSQVARTVFGRNALYLLVQIATALILILAANTSFADFPRLSSS